MRRAARFLISVGVVALSVSFVAVDEGAAQDDHPRAELVLDLGSTTSRAGAVDGLLGIGLVPRGDQLLVLRTTKDGYLELERYPYRTGEEIRADRGRPVFRLPHRWVHSGGGIAFLPSGDLLVSIVADLGGAGGVRPPDGVVVRIPAASLAGESGPLEPAELEVVARGLRNPFRISVDEVTGDVWIGDVGEHAREEVNLVRGADLGRVVPDFGWPWMEGSTPFLVTDEPPPDLALPQIEYGRGDGRCAVLAGLVNRGDALPSLDGEFVFGDYCNNVVRVRGPDGDEREIIRLPSSPTKFATDGSGRMWVLTGVGDLYRLDEDRGTSESGFSAELVGSLWPRTGAQGSEREATDLVVAPTEMLIAERSGLIGRIRLTAGSRRDRLLAAVVPEPSSEEPSPDECRVIPDLYIDPLTISSPADFMNRVVAVENNIRELREVLPIEFSASLDAVARAVDELRRIGSETGWDASQPVVTRFLLLLQAERGPYSSTLRAQGEVIAFTQRCNRPESESGAQGVSEPSSHAALIAISAISAAMVAAAWLLLASSRRRNR